MKLFTFEQLNIVQQKSPKNEKLKTNNKTKYLF